MSSLGHKIEFMDENLEDILVFEYSLRDQREEI